MEVMLFSVIVVIFWIPSIALLIAAILSFKIKQSRKVLLLLSLVSFSIPFIIVLGTRINQIYEKYSFQGVYLGKDSSSNNVVVEIGEDSQFTISIENLEKVKIIGSWHYSPEYDAFLFYANNNKVSIYENDREELILHSDIITDCCVLDKIKLYKKQIKIITNDKRKPTLLK